MPGLLTLEFQHDNLNEDGSAFDATQFAGVEYSINGDPWQPVPANWAPDGTYTVQAEVNLAIGDYTVAVRMLHTDGTESEASDPAFFTVAPRRPNRPSGLSASFAR